MISLRRSVAWPEVHVFPYCSIPTTKLLPRCCRTSRESFCERMFDDSQHIRSRRRILSYLVSIFQKSHLLPMKVLLSAPLKPRTDRVYYACECVSQRKSHTSNHGPSTENDLRSVGAASQGALSDRGMLCL